MLLRTNVSNIGDPFILNDDHYYMYCTDFDVEGFKVRISDDLINWETKGIALDLSNSWAYKSFWAPEVVKHNDVYIMHYSARCKKDNKLRIGVATSSSPLGPFKDVYNGPMFDLSYACIDGHVLKYEDKYYLFYSRDCSDNYQTDGKRLSQIYVLELSEDLLSVKGEPKLIISPDKDYDCIPHNNCMWNEGPAIIQDNGLFYLAYSANFFASNNYSICIATSNNPLGPYIKCDDYNPLLKSLSLGNDFSGPGHNCFFKDKQGNTKIAFHIQTDENSPSQNRKACIADVKFVNKRMVIEL